MSSQRVGLSANMYRVCNATLYAALAAAVLIAVFFRCPGLDQSMLLLIAQEYVLGKTLYVDILDFHPPTNTFIHSPPLLLHHWLGWPLPLAWNLYVLFLCLLSGLLFWKLVVGRSSGWVAAAWTTAILLVFDDHITAQREFIFSIFWLPYLAARLQLVDGPARGWGFSVGFIVGLLVCSKPHFALFVLILDLPLFLFRPRNNALVPFLGLVISGLIQLIVFFIFFGQESFWSSLDQLAYYSTVGFHYGKTASYIIGATAVWLLAVLLVVILRLPRPWTQEATFVALCGGTGLVQIAVTILQGYPRAPYLTPIALSVLGAAFILLRGDPKPAIPGWRRPAVLIGCALVPLLFSVDAHGSLRGVYRKYILGQQVQFIGHPPQDLYYDWVRQNVRPTDEIAVIAMEFGASLDPVLSMVRLGRRVYSHMPVSEFPLRAALSAGDPRAIETAFRALISDVEKSKAHWLIISRKPPGPPLETDIHALLHTYPTFRLWREAKFAPHSSFGEYFVYVRRKD